MAAKILIADDEHGYRCPIADIFEDAGFDPVQAESEEEVMEYAPDADVWVVDVRLPTSAREGIRAVMRLVDSGKVPKLPVVFISVDKEDDAKDQLAALKAQNVRYEWHEKPFEPELLLRTVQHLLGEE